MIKNHQDSCLMKAKLRRSRNKMIAGVCAGFAEYFDLEVTLVRVAYVLLSCLSVGFPGVLIYVILWVVMPLDEADHNSYL
jgi:phage shock protein C